MASDSPPPTDTYDASADDIDRGWEDASEALPLLCTARSSIPRAMSPTPPAAKAQRSVALQRSAPRNPVRPVLTPPRPTSSLRSNIPRHVAARFDVDPAPAHTECETAPAPPAEPHFAGAHDSAVDTPTVEAPEAILAVAVLEGALRPPPLPSELRETSQSTLHPNHIDLASPPSGREFRTHPPRALLAVAAVAVLAGVVWLVARSSGSDPHTVAALRSAPPPTATPFPVSAAPPRVAGKAQLIGQASATPGRSDERTSLADAVESTFSDTEDTVPVTVRVSPHHAVVFKNGVRVGTGDVTLNVVRGTKTTLVARLDGYLPRTIGVDGRYTSINIVLKRRESAPAPVPRGAPSHEAAVSSSTPTVDTIAPPHASPSPDGIGGATSSPANSVSDAEPGKPSAPVSTSGAGRSNAGGS